ncbi:unnamed protein product [Blepharisma stoltei]|uniref:Uncharacterized protein n=1 Tax=Blepharisma stoltei TaxID=1481888 RepID=A0AAU9JE42_9CILI|nr:unnamed protein product [Blepharisma stoltei]
MYSITDEFVNMLVLQQQIVNQIVVANKQISDSLDNIIEQIKLINHSNSSQSQPNLLADEHAQIDQIFQWASANNNFVHFIQLADALPSVIYKEKGFELRVFVADKNDIQIQIPNTQKFKVLLFSSENPPKLLKLNISGKKIIRGTTESVMYSDGFVYFSNVVINEVTSHYTNDAFYLVIMALNSTSIKPLVIGNVSVKARKTGQI